jgi:ERCC4-type nuclease
LASLRELGDVRLWRTADEEETAAYICEEYAWWQKEWRDHRTGHGVYAPDPNRKKRQNSHKTTFRTSWTLTEKWLAALPGVDSRAEDLAAHFSSPLDLANADAARWTSIKGIGKKTAESIIGAIHEGR